MLIAYRVMINIWAPPEIPPPPDCVGLATALQTQHSGSCSRRTKVHAQGI